MRRSLAKVLSILLSIMLVLSSLPAPAFAEMAEEVMGVESGSATVTEPAEAKRKPGEGSSSDAGTPVATNGMGANPNSAAGTPETPVPNDAGADPEVVAPQESTDPTSVAEPQPASDPAPGEGSERTVSAAPSRESADKPEGPTNDELFDAYAQRLIDESVPGRQAEDEVSLGTQSAADGLTGANLVCYNKLKTLVQSVAAGDTTEAATTVKCSELGVESFGPWTAEDLGVPSVSVDDYVPSDAFAKIRERLGVDTGAILNAIRADFPYDLYWFDAVTQGAFATGMTNIKVRTVNGRDSVDVTNSTLTFVGWSRLNSTVCPSMRRGLMRLAVGRIVTSLKGTPWRFTLTLTPRSPFCAKSWVSIATPIRVRACPAVSVPLMPRSPSSPRLSMFETSAPATLTCCQSPSRVRMLTS